MRSKRPHILLFCLVVLMMAISCSKPDVMADRIVDNQPLIFPDYTDVTVPPNLVSPCFWLLDSCEEAKAIFRAGPETYDKVAHDGKFSLTEREWSKLKATADSVTVTVVAKRNGLWTAFAPFSIYVAKEPIDKFIAYRMIEPGYETWNEMGIYQRCLESYREDPIITNRQTEYGCVSCHSFSKQDPGKMLIHLRAGRDGTYIIDDGVMKQLDVKASEADMSLGYPAWHPTGDYVAFSVNDTKQMLRNIDRNRIEVFDDASDVVVYDVNKNELISSPLLKSEESLESYPTFAPDGRKLYFCSADKVNMPQDFENVRYNICAIAFDPVTRTFGNKVDTLYNAAADGYSASLPRVSPDGRWLMFTRSAYGTFPIWHRDADLCMIDLNSGEVKALDALNSDEADSYHSWSSNGRWVVFGSRRIDGLYTRPYIAYIDADGNARKPLIVPQHDRDHYQELMKSITAPEFITAPIPR